MQPRAPVWGSRGTRRLKLKLDALSVFAARDSRRPSRGGLVEQSGPSEAGCHVFFILPPLPRHCNSVVTPGQQAAPSFEEAYKCSGSPDGGSGQDVWGGLNKGGERREANPGPTWGKESPFCCGGGMLFPEALTQAASCIPRLSEWASGCLRSSMVVATTHPNRASTSAIHSVLRRAGSVQDQTEI